MGYKGLVVGILCILNRCIVCDISIEDVPTTRSRKSIWDDVFATVPAGQALVLHEPEVNAATIRAILIRRQKEGKYKNLKMIAKGARGSSAIYIMNTDKSIQHKPLDRVFK